MIKSTIGLYGISGSGKSWHLARLRKLHPEWSCVEGSQVISEILGERGADLKTFSVMNADEKLNIRDLAISRIQQRPGVTVVAGHCSFPKVPTENSPPGHPLTFDDVFTQGDAETYQAVLYLDRSAHDVLAQRLRDNSTETRLRSCLSLEEIDQWIQHEKVVLQRECSKHGLDFFLVRDADDPAKHISEHILDPLFSDAERRSIASLKSAVQDIPDADVYLLLDGDRTLCPEDTGTQFFHQIDGDGATLKKIHQRYPKYSFRAFLETAMLYATVADYKLISSRTAENVEMYSEWVSFLSQLPPKVHAVLVSSGNREIWQAVLRQHDLIGNAESTDISIIAGNHVSLHSYVVDDAAKELVVTELRKRSGGSRIMAFGDSVIDVPMLAAADRGYIAVDTRRNRSMAGFIEQVVASNNPAVYQLSIQQNDNFLHDHIKVGSLSGLLDELTTGTVNQVIAFTHHASAKVLATKSRRSDITGPSLQSVHIEIGIFLADRLLDTVCREGNMFAHNREWSHVQGTTFQGLSTNGAEVMILPLMRGGEPMSRGLHRRFPSAQVVHWDDHRPLSNDELSLGATTDVIIVDSVINSGKSIRRVLQHLQTLTTWTNSPRVYVLTAVMQSVASTSLPLDFPKVRFLALRVSDNKYSGQGGTDTGNRLFGTVA